jgi:phage-related protein
MLVVIAVIALAAGIIYAYKHSATFRKIVHDAFHAVLVVVQAVWHWIKNNWPYLLAILLGPFGFVVGWVIKHWSGITHAVSAVYDWIKSNWPLLLEILFGPFGLAEHMIRTHWNGIMNFFKGLPGKIGSFLKDIGNVVAYPFIAGFNLIAKFWNDTVGKLHFNIPGWVPHFGGHGFSMPTLPVLPLPKLHQGGTVMTGGLANIQPSEEVVYLPPAASVVPLGDARTVPGSIAAGDSGQPTTIQLVVDRKVLAETVYDHTRDKVARR